MSVLLERDEWNEVGETIEINLSPIVWIYYE